MRYAVQVGSFADRNNAKILQKKLKNTFRDVYVSVFQTHAQTYHRVRIKSANRDDAEAIILRLYKMGLVAFIVEEF